MGRKIDALLNRSGMKGSKFKPLVNLALHRLVVLKNQRQVRCNIAKSDVVEILKMGLHDRALLRVEHVIKEQNMLDVFLMIHGYCDLVLERFHVIEQDKVCPEELREAVSSLIYAASRCGEFPELQEIRAGFTSHYGKEFAAKAVELRNNCGVSLTLIQKLSTRMPSLETRTSVLKQIADENGIALQLAESSAETRPEAPDAARQEVDDDNMENDRFFAAAMGKKYDNAADAAQAAFESAAYAAHAARAAVELSRGDSHDPSSGSSSPFTLKRKIPDQQEDSRSGTRSVGMDIQETEEANAGLKKSLSISSDSTDNLDSDEVTIEVSRTDKVDYKVEQNTTMNESRMDDVAHKETDEQSETSNSQGMPMPEDDHSNQAPEESWIRRGWNSKIEKMKRPFSHRSKGVATS